MNLGKVRGKEAKRKDWSITSIQRKPCTVTLTMLRAELTQKCNHPSQENETSHDPDVIVLLVRPTGLGSTSALLLTQRCLLWGTLGIWVQ